MATRFVAVQRNAPAPGSAPGILQGSLLGAAPAVAVAGGMAAQWLDFQALRIPLLLFVDFGVLATAYTLTRAASDRLTFALAVLTGVATWGAVQVVYSIIHVASGERFHADRFGPQPLQAISLIAAHAVFLGAPTGIAAGAMLFARRRFGQRSRATR